MKKTGILATVLGLLFFGQVLFGVLPTVQAADTDIFIYAVGAGPVDLDQHYMWDSASIDVAKQVIEGLFCYDLSQPDLPLIKRLAADDGDWNDDATAFTVALKENVWFHDGTHFNAESVKWNFERLNAFIEAGECNIAELYAPIDEELLVKNVTIVDNYTVTFNLNYAYIPFKALLAFPGSFFTSPSSTPQTDYMQVGEHILVGTGPYQYVSYVADEAVTFDYWPYYYGGTPGIKHMVWQVIADGDAKATAFINKQVHMVDAVSNDYFATINATTGLTVHRGPSRTTTAYLGMNNNKINATFRKAMSYAFPYDYWIYETLGGFATRLNSPIPMGIQYGKNMSAVAPYTNITIARQTMQAAGFGVGFTTDQDWIDVAESATPFAAFNYTYNTGGSRARMLPLLVNSSKLIGINVVDDGITWANFLNMLYGTGGKTHDDLEIYQVGWGADYNDASNYINPLMSPTSSSNSAQINSTELNALMNEGLTETDPVARQVIYEDIQELFVTELYSWVLLTVGQGWDCWNSADLSGFPQNSMGEIWFFPCTFKGTATVATFNTDTPPVHLYNTPPTEEPTVPGFSVAFTLLAALATVSLIIKKRK